MEELKTYIAIAARVVEVVGVLAILIGATLSLIRFLVPLAYAGPRSYRRLRQDLGKSILLGLEILVAGDIIATVVTEPTMNRVLVLGLIVLIRTFLSFSLEIEIEGRFPWEGSETKP